MDKMIIAYDLGTGGVKASVFDLNGVEKDFSFYSYNTSYPEGNMHEQKPADWWNGIIKSTKKLLTDEYRGKIAALAISGHSLGVVPLDKEGNLLRENTPIWSDTRASAQSKSFFKVIDYENWYMTTGNGFPPECYSLFKMMWYKEHEPEMFDKVYKIIGTKDYCNYKLTGIMCTDHSYASGSGAYDLLRMDYRADFIEAAGLDPSLFPEILASDSEVGTLTSEAAELLGLSTEVKVICGGVDNSCMALGARGIEDGRLYTSLGSSSWIALTSHEPVLNSSNRTFVFAHVIEGMYASATSIFAAGSSLKWARNTVGMNLVEQEESGGKDAFVRMNELAAESPVGANKLIFNPSLAGGSMIEESPLIKGGFVGLTLSHSQSDMIRSVFEGIALNLRFALEILAKTSKLAGSMLMVGGGSKSDFWRQMFADIFNMEILKTNIDQNAASLGAAALAAKGAGLWKDYSIVDKIHHLQTAEVPEPGAVGKYDKIYPKFRQIAHYMSESGKILAED
ncbi:MAG: FGGY-family carbohydrate kinase [Spirochaetales bacterium]|uniref:FGGY-family carbohydrate kinase n=1 Tax=Candidatus Thalassospirochaeta sargassi TaxID=3119039 RepID=A0AAJ1MJR6_9SPIO|nr:FGGY-family carbohydrate kinase [Spirochaetales bacterium]